MHPSHSYTLKFILFFAVVTLSQTLQCSDCPAGNSCCVDYLDGARCYNPAQAKCASTQQTGSNGASTYRLCGLNDSACGSDCYDPRSYYCCAGQLKQNSQPCDSNAATQTVAPTAAPTQSPTSATTQAPTSAPTTAAPKYNCMAIGGQYGVNCSAGETCCGAQTMSPSCLPANGSKTCCQYYLSATQCNPDQVCGGQLGSGASSNAQCGPPNSTFCFIGFQLNTFCSASQPVCCGQGTSYAFCCAAGATCNNTGGTCVPKPSTTAPTVTPPVSKSPVTAQPNNTVVPCPGVNGYGGQNCSSGQTCCGYGKLSTFCLNSGPSEEYKCCTWYLSAAKCKKNEVCGGSGGVGASSYAQCGPPGSVFCNKGTAQNSFCSADQKCCGVEGERSFCCGANQACNNTNLTCSG